MRQIRRILFIRTDRIGDTLMNLPAIHLLRQTYPKAWISLLLDKPMADLLYGHPDADEVMTMDSARFNKSFFERLRLLAKIRWACFDMAIVSNPDRRLHFLIFAAGIPLRVGYRRKWGFLLNKSVPVSNDRVKRHEIENNLELVRCVSDKTWDGSFCIPTDERTHDELSGFLMQAFQANIPIVAFHTGTSDPKKRWPVDKFIDLIRRFISKHNFPVLLIGGPEEAFYTGRIRQAVGPTVVDWAGTLTLKQLAALLGHERVKTLVSSDSGPMHIAWMQGKPVVAFFAKNTKGSDPDRWGPRNQKSEIVYKEMNELTVDEVLESLERVLKA